MNRLLIVFLLILLITKSKLSYSQDVIHKINGEVLQVQIIATSKTDITYMLKTKGNQDTTITIDRSEVTSFRRASENEEMANAKEYNSLERLAIYEEGKMDADIYYTRYKRPGTLVLLTSLISPIVGLVPAIISSATPVKDQNKWYPPSKTTRIDAYYGGYAMQAKRKKQQVVWRNFTIGLAANLLAAIIFLPRI